VQDVELGNAMPVAQRAHPLERASFARGHLGEVSLDVGEIRAVPPGEAPAARGHATGRLDHLLHASRLDRARKQVVDDPMPGQQESLEGGPAEHPARAHRRT
jgi:hypothetical protein